MLSEKISLTVRHQLFILVFLAIGLNANTLFNEYALDDIVVLTENRFVQKGIKGIPEILSEDFLKGWKGENDIEYSGSRYRPFTFIVFALEYQFFGKNPFVSHLINISLFVLLIALLYKLLQGFIFREHQNNLAFFTCLLFVTHPIHTEVIANVKSRDEIITFILLIISLLTIIKHIENKRPWSLITGLICFFLALLTRESSIAFIAVIPLIIYFFYNQSIKKIFIISFQLFVVFLGYLALRYWAIGFNISTADSVLYAPFLYASASQAFATKIFIIFKYFWLLVFPHPLSSDYSYNEIQYVEIFSYQFILSSIFILCLIAYAIYTFKKKSILSFSVLYFLATIFLVSNIVFDIGVSFAERFLFQPSLTICIAAAIIFLEVSKRSKMLSNILLLVVLLLFSIKTYSRNCEWKNNETLFIKDVITAPNSVRTTLFASEIFREKAKNESNKKLKDEYLRTAVFYGERTLDIDSRFAVAYLHLGMAYYYLSDYKKAAELWIQGRKLNPDDPEAKKCTTVLSALFYKQANGLLEQGNIDSALKCYNKSIELDSANVEAWYNLGGIYFLKNDSIHAMQIWDSVKKLEPTHQFNKEEFLNYYNPKK